MEMLKIWNDLVGKDTVEPSDTDEDHIRNLLEMPENQLYDRACDHGWAFACAVKAQVAMR